MAILYPFSTITRYCLFLLLFAGATRVIAQPYQNGHISVTFTDSARSNRSVPVELYYPADVAGDNVPFAAGLSSAPVIAFGHGFVMTYDAYFNVRDAVVSQGYIIAFPTTEGSLSPSHQEFGVDLAFVLQRIQALGGTTGSVLFGKVDTFHCVMGHSMGGGAAFLAAAADPGIKAIATLAPAETSPSAIAAASGITAPALVFAGANDCVTPPADHQLPMYNALVSSCKKYISITGGSHCQMAESSFTCSIGESSCTPQPAITRPQQHAVIDAYLVPWLDHQLKSSCVQGALFDSALAADPAITYLGNCVLCPSLSLAEQPVADAAVAYPNPCGAYLQLKLPYSGPAQIRICSIDGREVAAQTFAGGQPIAVSQLAPGVYFYEVGAPAMAVFRGSFVKR
ncbi:MAG: T9SS type A sorting domain-containing protein [Flavipsychrobacter sp.]|nr:T9SS type A sorting domain-containing protein [Flavipsychrobacter sp.]